MDDIRKEFERDTGLGWEQDGAEYAREHYVAGYQAGRAHGMDELIAEIKERSWSAKNYNGDYMAVYMDDVEEIIRKHFGKE